MAILVTGGARSGKSGFAEQYARRMGDSGIYIATCASYDEEMNERIERHRRDRGISGFHWETIEEPYGAAGLLDELALRYRQDGYGSGVGNYSAQAPPAVLLDCLTLWLTNWILRLEQGEIDRSEFDRQTDLLIGAIADYPFPLIIVTNEVGDGIVPPYPLGRLFRDEAGRLNQRAAALCDRVFLVTAGIPVDLKAIAFRWDEL